METKPIVNNKPEVQYNEWKESFLNRFKDETETQRLRKELYSTKQKQDQKAQSFISKINSLYTQLNGKYLEIPANSSVEARALAKSHRELRDEDRKSILMKGLLPKLRNEAWTRMPMNANYETTCKMVLEAENVLFNKEYGDDETLINAVYRECRQDTNDLREDVNKIKSQLDKLILTMINMQEGLNLSLADRSNSLSQSRDSSFASSRDTSRNSSGDRSREHSRERLPKPYFIKYRNSSC